MRTAQLLCALGAGALLFAATASAQQDDLENEIKRVRKELMQVQEERQLVKDDATKDKADFEVYRKRILERMRALRLETDSIQKSIRIYSSTLDSLDALVNAEKNNIHRYELQQTDFRTILISACDTIKTRAQALPPTVSDKISAATTLLHDELASKSVDNIEAVHRLFQILKDLHEQAAVIQIVQGASPLPEIRGTTYQLRLGLLFEAVVNAQGTQAALWTGYDQNGTPQWESISDVLVAQQMLKAVNVREGKSLPSLVQLPLHTVTVEKGDL